MYADLDPALISRLAALLSEVTGAPVGALSVASSRDNTANWDSVANLQLISAVEEEFGVIIPTADALKLRCLADVARFIANAGAPSRAAGGVATDRPRGG